LLYQVKKYLFKNRGKCTACQNVAYKIIIKNEGLSLVTGLYRKISSDYLASDCGPRKDGVSLCAVLTNLNHTAAPDTDHSKQADEYSKAQIDIVGTGVARSARTADPAITLSMAMASRCHRKSEAACQNIRGYT